MYQKWDITFCLHLPRFLCHFFVFFSSFFRLSFVNPITIMPAFYPENRPLTSCVLFVRRRRDYTHNGILLGIPNVPKWHKIRWSVMPKRNRIDTFDDGLSSRSMTTTAAKGANNPQKMSQFGAGFTLFQTILGWFLHIFQTLLPRKLHIFQPTNDYDRRPTHTFPRVLLGFLYVFPNKKPVRRGFLKGYLIAFSDSHFGITGFTSFGHSISMVISSDDVGRSATK